MTQPSLEPGSVAAVIASAIFSPALAHVVGPYALIILAANAGAAWSLGQRRFSTRTEGFGYFALVSITAAVLTAGMVQLIQHRLQLDEPEWLLGPTAFFIGMVGNRWPMVFRWVLDRARRVLSGGPKERTDE